MIVEWCVANAISEKASELEALGHLSYAYDAIEYPCLDHCDLCVQTPYLLIDGKLLEDPDPDALFKRVVAQFAREQRELADAAVDGCGES
ncbi:DUF1450 domain-containing protein [Ferroacidibacillus organovorans]|uniref:UDP-N-acetylmuramoylalanine--D-glutamate ligase n=1 Tax=Ferroacidibacillus organovorans TaxID=1765683 RepID=A0A853KEE3_9BACL|nr:DUF1450 domain-containing protein [Ferroacidibacillus organovorans]KYP80851.1 hypothetical protein AYJ22_01455 [Ferroacidibacillus organovorans]OAG95396.1 hypothetical protein AYW79_00335 [Ferroacidibacillus organovorans]